MTDWRPLQPDHYKYQVQCIIEEIFDKLTEWEVKFIGQVDFALNAGWPISQAQANTLDNIFRKITR